MGVVWTMALAGVALKTCFIKTPRRLNTALYLLMGWLAVVAVTEILATLPAPAIA